jgi:hypothetical protein
MQTAPAEKYYATKCRQHLQRSIMQQNADSTCREVKCKIKTQAINVKNN